MSLTKKKHEHIQDAYLKALLLAVDDFLDTHYTFRCEKRYQSLWGKFLAIGDISRAEEAEAKLTQGGDRYCIRSSKLPSDDEDQRWS